MNGIKLNSIEGLMVAGKPIAGSNYLGSGWNACVTEQGSRELTLDREELAITLFTQEYGSRESWYKWDTVQSDELRKECRENADAIIANQSQIIKAVV